MATNRQPSNETLGASDIAPCTAGSPRISVVMSVFNGAQFLEEAIMSILNQTYNDFEFIIIDDASIDRTSEVLKKFKDPRIIVLKNDQNIGLTKSLNIGIRHSKGEFIARMDADDISLPHRFEAQIRYLKTHPDYALIGSWAYQIDETGDCQCLIKLQVEDREIRECLIRGNNFVHGSVMMRRSVILSIGGYDERFQCANDYELWLRIIENHKVANLTDPLYCWRSLTTQISSARKKEQYFYAEMARQEAKERAEKSALNSSQHKRIMEIEEVLKDLHSFRDWKFPAYYYKLRDSIFLKMKTLFGGFKKL